MDVTRYMTSRQAADHLGLSRSRIDQFVRDGRLRPIQVGNLRLIPRAQVEALAAQPRPVGRPRKETPKESA